MDTVKGIKITKLFRLKDEVKKLTIYKFNDNTWKTKSKRLHKASLRTFTFVTSYTDHSMKHILLGVLHLLDDKIVIKDE